MQLGHMDGDQAQAGAFIYSRGPGLLLPMVLAYMGGIYMGWTLPFDPLTIFSLITAGFLTALVSIRWTFQGLFFLSALFLFLGLGMGRVYILSEPGSGHIQNVPDGASIDVDGRILTFEHRKAVGLPGERWDWYRSKMKVHRIRTQNHWQTVKGTINLYAFRYEPGYRPGDRIQTGGVLNRRKHTEPRNPGESSFEWHRVQNGYGGMIVVRDRRDWHSKRNLSESGFFTKIRHLRYTLYHLLDESGDLNILPALLLGFRTHISGELNKIFARGGVIHFLAVSGFHVGFLVMACFFLLRRYRVPPGVTRILLGFILLIYVLLTGLRTPTIRAAMMVGLVLTGIVLGRSIRPLQILSVAALIQLIWKPLDLFSAGFQFSYLSVIVLLLAAPMFTLVQDGKDDPKERILREFSLWHRIRYLVEKGLRWLGGIALGTAIVIQGTAPIALYHFQLFSPVSLLMNPLLFPFIPLLLACGWLFMGMLLLLELLPIVSPTLLQGPGRLLVLLEHIMLVTVRGVSLLPGSYFYLPFPGLIFSVLFGSILFAGGGYLLYDLKRPGFLLVFAPLLTICYLFFPSLSPSDARENSITFLDMEHGGASVIQTKGGRTFLYDAGSMGVSDPGTFTILPALFSQDIESLDAIILSHPDRDHYSGLFSLLDHISVKELWVPVGFRNQTEGNLLLRQLRKNHPDLGIRFLHAGDRLKIPELTFDVLGPPPPHKWPGEFPSLSSNAISLVIELQWKRGRVLLTGDLAGKGMDRLLKGQTLPSEVDVMQIPHHGGGSTVETPLLPHLQVGAAPVHTDRKLSPDLTSLYKREETPILSTYHRGAVRFLCNETGIHSYRWNGEWRYLKQINPPNPPAKDQEKTD